MTQPAGEASALVVPLVADSGALHDRVRHSRGPLDPATLSTGSAGELAGLMGRLARGELVSAAVSRRLDGWLATSTDLSMVASGFRADPLARHGQDGPEPAGSGPSCGPGNGYGAG